MLKSMNANLIFYNLNIIFANYIFNKGSSIKCWNSFYFVLTFN